MKNISKEDIKNLYYFCDDIENRFRHLFDIYPEEYKIIIESINNLYKSISKIEKKIDEDISNDQIHGKVIKKITCEYMTEYGQVIKFYTEDCYILYYEIGEYDKLTKSFPLNYIKKNDSERY